MYAHIRIPQNKVYELTESEWAVLANQSDRADRLSSACGRPTQPRDHGRCPV